MVCLITLMYDLNVLGEKYLGNWLNNMKNGNGLMVTQEGIYYEGVFVQDVLTVRGVAHNSAISRRAFRKKISTFPY